MPIADRAAGPYRGPRRNERCWPDCRIWADLWLIGHHSKAHGEFFAHIFDPPARIGDNLPPVETILSVLQVAISVIVIFLVLMHSGKDSGLSGAFGVGSGTGPLGGGSMVERNLNRWTIFFAILFLVNAIILLKRPWA
jgi:preprotein translocase subunit SecG